MTPDQLIELLEKAGMLKEESPGVLGWHPTMEKAERFAAIVADRCAEIADKAEPYQAADLIRKAFGVNK